MNNVVPLVHYRISPGDGRGAIALICFFFFILFVARVYFKLFFQPHVPR